MNDTIIKVEGVGKKYIISHEQAGGYKALRDVISHKARNLVKAKKISLPAREEFWALKDLNFEIKRGEAVGIIGRNGAGKSTLLKILSRITEPTTGRIELNGRVASLLEVGTGFHPELTGRENIFLNGAILGMGRKEIRRKFDEIVDFSGVEKFLDTPVKRYSSGMYVRLAFAVAAHLEPEILVVDEVLAVGDSEFQKKCLGKMNEVSKNEGRTVLFVSHQMGMITQLCNSAILLKNGEIYTKGQCKNVLDIYINSANISETTYNIDLKKINSKQNYFTSISPTNNEGQHVSNFSFDESIHLNFKFVCNELNPNIQIGIALSNMGQSRVFTVLKPVHFFNKNANEYEGKLIIPNSLIAPGKYSFTCALWTINGQAYDLLENICYINIVDSGTDFSIFEGIDYGNVIIKPKWE